YRLLLLQCGADKNPPASVPPVSVRKSRSPTRHAPTTEVIPGRGVEFGVPLMDEGVVQVSTLPMQLPYFGDDPSFSPFFEGTSTGDCLVGYSRHRQTALPTA